MTERRSRVRRRPGPSADRGQAAVEFVALLPVLTAATLCLAQCAVAGYSAWSASAAARVGARAQALGSDPRGAVRRALPAPLRDGARIRAAADGAAAGRVTVRLAVPSVVPGLSLGTVAGRAQLPDQAGA